MTFGCVESFLTIALPKYQQPNPTGVILDFHQISWIGKIFIPEIEIDRQICNQKVSISSESEPNLTGVWPDDGWSYF